MPDGKGNLNVTVGALLIGVLVTAVGYGITTMQTYMYYTRFPRDPRYIKYIVASLLVLDTAHVALSWHAIYHYLILNFGNHDVLEDSVWSFNLTIVLTSIITVIVHCFFARRVYILGNGNWVLTCIIILLSIIRLVFGFYVTIQIFILKNLGTLPLTLSPFVGTALSAGTVGDFIVTGSLVYYLRKHKTGFSTGTDSLVDRIVSWSVNNGLLTSVVGMTVIITFSAMPDNMIFLAVHLFLSKLYANSLLGTLNFRKAHRGRGLYDEPTTIGTLHLSKLRFAGLPRPRFDTTDTSIDFNPHSSVPSVQTNMSTSREEAGDSEGPKCAVVQASSLNARRGGVLRMLMGPEWT